MKDPLDKVRHFCNCRRRYKYSGLESIVTLHDGTHLLFAAVGIVNEAWIFALFPAATWRSARAHARTSWKWIKSEATGPDIARRATQTRFSLGRNYGPIASAKRALECQGSRGTRAATGEKGGDSVARWIPSEEHVNSGKKPEQGWSSARVPR